MLESIVLGRQYFGESLLDCVERLRVEAGPQDAEIVHQEIQDSHIGPKGWNWPAVYSLRRPGSADLDEYLVKIGLDRH